MKYMLVMSQPRDAVSAADLSPEEMAAMFEEMGRYNEELIAAGVMAGGDGLAPDDEGTRIDFDGDDRTVTDGPFTETKEVFQGFWILDCATQEEAVEWARKAPLRSGNIVVRRIPSIDEFPQDLPSIQKEREYRIAQGEKLD